MRAGLHSWSFRERFRADPSFGIRDFIAIAADLGFTGVELLTGMAGGDTGHLGTAEPRAVEAIVRFAESRGVRVDSFSTYNDFAHVPNEAWRLANIAYVKEWLALAGACGVPNIRMLTGYHVRGASQVRLQRLTLDGIRECAPHAERARVNMALENHSSVFLEAEDILWLIAEIGSPRLTTCPDPTNWSAAFLAGTADAAERELVFRGVELVAPRATQSHLKIAGITADGHLQGFGADGLGRLIRIYRDAGYAGALAFEHVGPGDVQRELALAKVIVDRAIAVDALPTTPAAATATARPGA
ncbi:MAG TPA: sugar phosphate isomerase/epimerase family protein [Planctomycetota bacterium]|nr:sugar phosphate isomerase/epimerase family protein [Planctomycetota bacterium]